MMAHSPSPPRTTASDCRLFILEGLLISSLSGSLHHLRERVQTRAAEIQLQQEMQVRERTCELAEANRALQSEIAQRKGVQETLAREREFLMAVLQNIGDGVVACDASEALTFFNHAAERVPWKAGRVGTRQRASWSLRSVQGRWDHLLVDRGNATAPRLPGRAHPRCRTGDRFRDGRAAGHSRQWPTSLKRTGEKLGAVVVLRDITERKRAEEQIRGLNESLELRLQRLGVLRRIDAGHQRLARPPLHARHAG